MRAFEVCLNGKRLCLAGIGDDGVLTTILTHVAGNGHYHVDLHAGGLICPEDRHVSWVQRQVKVGDEITVKVVEASLVDPPKKKSPKMTQKEALAERKRGVRKMARELGLQVVAKPAKKGKR